MEAPVHGWSQGVHQEVACLKCHEPDPGREITHLLSTITGKTEKPECLRVSPEQCTKCHAVNPRWAGIAAVADAPRNGDSPFSDLSVVANAHLIRSDCQHCHDHTAHRSAELTATSIPDGKIALDGRLDEPAWQETRPLIVPIMGGNAIGRINVELRALHTGKELVLAARWPDSRDDAEKAMWKMGSDGRWHTLGVKRAGEAGNEDRVMFFWNVDMPGFEKEGCLVACHMAVSAAKYLESPGMGDTWHWKAARSNPAGYCDDKYINHIREGGDGGRHGDFVKSEKGTQSNVNAAGDGPMFMPDPKIARPDPRFLFKENAIPIPPGASWPAGTRIPGYVLSRPDGSRGDVSAKGRWEDGFWTVEFRRALVTGHRDDVAFDDLKKTYLFALAASDNASGAEHSFSGLLRLRFK